MAYNILVIDDDPSVLRLIKNALAHSDYHVTTREGVEAIELCTFVGYDLILLDIMMPIDGLEICRSIREQIAVPIIFITAKQLDQDLLKGLQAGADDYIKKPFSVKELIARVEMHIRREERGRKQSKQLTFGQLTVDYQRSEVKVDEVIVPLTKRECLIVYLLASNPHKIFSVEELYERLYPQDSDTQFRSISEYVYQIRTKLKPYAINPIKTQWGGGYRWNEHII